MDTLDMNINAGDYELHGLGRLNVLLGRNGVGKSRLLRAVDVSDTPSFSTKKYLSPERSGALAFQWPVEQQQANDRDFLRRDRRQNQASQFKPQSASQFARLETEVLRAIEGTRRLDLSYAFKNYLDQINDLLENIVIGPVPGQTRGIEFRAKNGGQPLEPGVISSGESELIALAIECLVVEFDKKPGEKGLILLDEPDVHLHPDLQLKLVMLIRSLAEKHDLTVLIATHSTAILAALADYEDARVGFMSAGQRRINFVVPSNALRAILPIFGAHPLTRVYSEMPLLIVEGDDDVRIWQQAVRSASGKLMFHPSACGGKGEMATYESEADKVLGAVYDTAIGYSLRDGDGVVEELEDIGRIVRCRLKCRSSENLLLTNEVLKSAKTDLARVRAGLARWRDEHQGHEASAFLAGIEKEQFDRMQANLKPIRNLLAAQLSTSKPWEVLVGQAIAALPLAGKGKNAEGTLAWALGDKFVTRVLKEGPA